ncbi:DNA-directed RNA polymerase subunit epsilon [Liquorilactobacillus sicerae]|uniref:DNA-directed RNA polymerase subunit epsilon n=1 Tax=Liquorilactobacillus sicerae TaxID=1416943 RepID=UPI002480C41F|nr:DNA-directed RNA polymerase subunit epsilon [Liquorilactobacillus sicerae]
MVFKVFYQPSKDVSPRRESTLALYLEAESEAQARLIVEEQTDYNIEYLEGLSPKALEYEKQSPKFKLTEFTK